ncbi:hypothetical protein D3C83_27450 [compost metagenome]
MGVVTASAFNLPALTCGIPVTIGTTTRDTWPAMPSVIACGLPRYGTCTRSTRAMYLKSSVARCAVVPLPAVP